MARALVLSVLFCSGILALEVGLQAPEEHLGLHWSRPVYEPEGEWWYQQDQLCLLTSPDNDNTVTAWCGFTQQALLLHVEVQDAKHVFPDKDLEIGRNDADRILFGIDPRAHGGKQLGIGDLGGTVWLDGDGQAQQRTGPSGVLGGGGGVEVSGSRDESAGLSIYDVHIPWPDLGTAAPFFPTIGLALYVIDADGEQDENERWITTALRFDNTAQERWDDRVLDRRWWPEYFPRVNLELGYPDKTAVDVVNGVVSDAWPELVLGLLLPSSDHEAHIRLGDEEMRGLIPRAGLVHVALAAAEPLTEPTPLQVDLLRGGEVVASCQATVFNDQRLNWYPWQASGQSGEAVWSLADWFTEAAGSHGQVRMVGKDLQAADGTVLRFWGCNIDSDTIYENDKQATNWANEWDRKLLFFRDYGINCLRLDVETGKRLAGRDSIAQLQESPLARLDHICAQAKQIGISYGFAADDELLPGPKDARRLQAYEEVAGGGRRAGISGFLGFAEDVQDLYIDHLKTVLAHTNPHTGQRYVDEPALVFLELRGGDTLFGRGAQDKIASSPTYRKIFCAQFSAWLKQRYGSNRQLREAWGEAAFGAEAWEFCDQRESLTARNVFPICDPWFYRGGNMADEEERVGARRRLLDTARFLYDTQQACFQRIERGLRDAGFQGALLASQGGGSGVCGAYDAAIDEQIGFQARGWSHGRGRASNPLRDIAGGPVRRGQLAERPFILDSWSTQNPYLWGAECVPLITAYGTGLQGWDAVFCDDAGSARFAEDLRDRSSIISPMHFGQFPIFARMLLRGDIQEGDLLATRYQDISQLIDDAGGMSGVPGDTWAVGRVGEHFGEGEQATAEVDLTPYQQHDGIVSMTGQLFWRGHQQGRYGAWWKEQGLITIASPGTAAVVGYAGGESHQLGPVQITSRSFFASIGLTAKHREGRLDNDPQLLLSVIGRAENNAIEWPPSHNDSPEFKGRSPIMLEPIKCEIRIERADQPTVHVLDHDGKRSGRTVPVSGGLIQIDTGRDQSPYYEIEYR